MFYVIGSFPPLSCHICYILLVSSGSAFLQIGPFCSLSCYKLHAPFHVKPGNSGKQISNDASHVHFLVNQAKKPWKNCTSIHFHNVQRYSYAIIPGFAEGEAVVS